MLKWIEQALAASGAIAAVCFALSAVEIDYANRAIPPRGAGLTATAAAGARPAHLPGEGGTAAGAPGSWVARLEAPSIGLAVNVLEGSDAATLSRAAGRIEYTAIPGERGNVGIAGHRDTVFRPLRHVKAGDLLRLQSAAGVQEYRVAWTSVVEPDAVHVLDATPHPALTLITCYPFRFVGSAPKRFIVRADLIRKEPASK
jgi:sortase A